ncbi:MAG: ABC transporter permease, partial [Acetobacteraceae bacterium]|nr:ABC transporter permease [Acetobacteraceae bacterium]
MSGAAIAASRPRLRPDPLAVAAALVIVGFCLLAIAAPSLLPYDPTAQSLLHRSEPPSAAHWFGTDRYGRDTFSRVLLGTRWSLLLGLSAPAIAGAVGTTLGTLAGYFGGWFDRVVARVTDMLMAFPALLLGL